MRRVTVKYIDGNEATYGTLKEAATSIGCTTQSLVRISCGGSTCTKKHLHIESVNIELNKGDKNSHRRKGKHPLRCTNEATGEVLISTSIRDAQKLTGNEAHNLSYIINDGKYHWGWKYETIKDDDVLDAFEFRDPVPDDVIDIMYRYAKCYMKVWKFPWEITKDAIQHIVCHTASDYSMGMYNGKNYGLKTWIWWECKRYGHEYVEKELWHERNMVEEPEDMKWDAVLGRNDDDFEMMQLFKDMPSELRLIAQLYLEGKSSRMELNTHLGVKDARRKELTATLVKWLKDRKNGS